MIKSKLDITSTYSGLKITLPNSNIVCETWDEIKEELFKLYTEEGRYDDKETTKKRADAVAEKEFPNLILAQSPYLTVSCISQSNQALYLFSPNQINP